MAAVATDESDIVLDQKYSQNRAASGPFSACSQYQFFRHDRKSSNQSNNVEGSEKKRVASHAIYKDQLCTRLVHSARSVKDLNNRHSLKACRDTSPWVWLIPSITIAVWYMASIQPPGKNLSQF